MPHPGPTWEDGDDQKILAGFGLRLIFRKTANRWIHAIERDNAEEIPLASSLETDPERSDATTIVSPAYQEIQPHDLGDAAGSSLCVLLTGRLFDHQFSAAVTFGLDPDRAGGLLIDWDVADRCRAPVSHLAATYQLPLGSGDLTDADGHSVSWSGETLRGGSLHFLAGPPENVALSEAGRNGTRVQAVAKLSPGVYTHRLRYRWRWNPGTDLAS